MYYKKVLFAAAAALLGIAAMACAGDPNESFSSAAPDTQVPSSSGESAASSTQESSSPEGTPSQPVNTVADLNTEPGITDSHGYDSNRSYVEMDYRSYRILSVRDLSADSAYYPRLKRMENGEYILFYQNGRWGPDILYITSPDLKTWSSPVKLWTAHEINGDMKYFATCDAVVLKNGDILAFCSFRTAVSYSANPSLNGLIVKTSADNAKTWSEERIVYVGTNWESYPLLLDSGEIQLYFTHNATFQYYHGRDPDFNASSAAIIRSYDGGKTWTPDVTGAPYEAWRVMQSHIGVYRNLDYYKAQMPVALQLHNGNIALACEACDIKQSFRIDMGYSSDNWSGALGFVEDGPADKRTGVSRGVAPYLLQFPSGETLLSYVNNSYMRFRVGNADARSFGNAISPFESLSTGLWSCTLLTGSHSAVAFCDYQPIITDQSTASKLFYAKLYLNHTITAKRISPAMDASGEGWQNNTDSVFTGSVSQAQCCVRVGNSDEKLYFLIERLDDYLSAEDETLIYFALYEKAESYYSLGVSPAGITSFRLFENGKWTNLEADSLNCALLCIGTVNDDSDSDTGYIAQAAVPKSLLPGLAGDIYIDIVMKNQDKSTKYPTDSPDGVLIADRGTWIRAVLE